MSRENDEWRLTARLASLELDEDEIERLALEAEKMRALFLRMSQADTDLSKFDLIDVFSDEYEKNLDSCAGTQHFRKDRLQPFPNSHELLDASSEVEDDYFLIPNVL